jgi:hypothetical protein
MPTLAARIAIIVSLCALGLTATAQTPPASLDAAEAPSSPGWWTR